MNLVSELRQNIYQIGRTLQDTTLLANSDVFARRSAICDSIKDNLIKINDGLYALRLELENVTAYELTLQLGSQLSELKSQLGLQLSTLTPVDIVYIQTKIKGEMIRYDDLYAKEMFDAIYTAIAHRLQGDLSKERSVNVDSNARIGSGAMLIVASIFIMIFFGIPGAIVGGIAASCGAGLLSNGIYLKYGVSENISELNSQLNLANSNLGRKSTKYNVPSNPYPDSRDPTIYQLDGDWWNDDEPPGH